MAQGLFNLKQVNLAIQQGAWATGTKPTAVDYLVVAGGGGGGGYYGSGGGAGGLLQGNVPVTAGSAITVTVGAGGTGASNGYGNNGSSSVFGSISTAGGGGGAGGSTSSTKNGNAGGSGGGGQGFGASAAGLGGAAVSGQGNAGGAGSGSGGGCGGGAGTAGLDSITIVGRGGAGISSAISGTVTAYAGGGAGAGRADSLGGVGGGGNSNVAGTANTGGGGGGDDAKSGGSGIVIISYPDVYAAPTATTGSPTVSTSGSGSLYLNNPAGASNQSLYYTSANNTALGAGDFCIEAFVWWSSSSGAAPYVATNFSGSTNFLWGIYQQSSLTFYVYGGVNLTSATLFTNNTWNHLVVCRTGTVTSMFLNGTKVATATDTVTYTYSNLYVGQNGAGTNFMNGYLSNFRIVVGNSIYTATASTITVPTAPFVATSQTKFLLSTVSPNAFLDSSASNLTPTLVSNSGSASWNASSPFTVTGYKNRVYTWTSSGSITF